MEAPRIEFTYPEDFNKEKLVEWYDLLHKQICYEFQQKKKEICQGRRPTDSDFQAISEQVRYPEIKRKVYLALGLKEEAGVELQHTITRAKLVHTVDPIVYWEIKKLRKLHDDV